MTDQFEFSFGEEYPGIPPEVDPEFLPRIWDGANCPTCGQFAKFYSNRKIGGAMSHALILIYRHWCQEDEDFFHVEDMLKATPGIPSSVRGDFTKLRHWDLIERLEVNRPDGSPRAGYYRITEKGIQFVKNLTHVQRYAWIYNTVCYGFRGEWVRIQDCFPEIFNYRELMGPILKKEV